MKRKPAPKVVAIRRTCKAEGIGLSHFVLMGKEKPKMPAKTPTR